MLIAFVHVGMKYEAHLHWNTSPWDLCLAFLFQYECFALW